MVFRHLVQSCHSLQTVRLEPEFSSKACLSMGNAKSPTPTATDWTRLLTDPELLSHLGKLLQTYREAPPEKREQALLAAMRDIKSGVPHKAAAAGAGSSAHSVMGPEATSTIPP